MKGLRNLVWTLTSDEHMRAVAGLERSLRTGESAFLHANGIGYFEYLRASPERGKAFDAMFAELRGGEHTAIAQAYDWRHVASVVDIGGGNGSLLATILQQHSQLRGILFDQEAALSSADDHLNAREVRARCELVAGDFFTVIRATGDVWLLSQVLHDWSDADCVRILRNCHANMRPGDRLLVAEILTVPSQPNPVTGLNDMLMLTLVGNGRQRTVEEYASLFSSCELEFTRVIPTESAFSLVEARVDKQGR